MALKKVELRPHLYIPFFWVLKSLRNSTCKRDANLWSSKPGDSISCTSSPPPPMSTNRHTPHHKSTQQAPKLWQSWEWFRTLYEVLHEVHTIDVCIHHYKITKIVCALWLAERSVCTRVCKHGCDVRCFAFRALITQAWIWKSFRDQNSTSLLYSLFTHSFGGWNLENLFKQAVSTFFCLSWHFKREKSVFWKESFCKTRTDYACKTKVINIIYVILQIFHQQNPGTKQETFFMHLQFYKTLFFPRLAWLADLQIVWPPFFALLSFLLELTAIIFVF